MNPDTLLYRQIRDFHIQNGHVSSAAFRPLPHDKDNLSVYDGDKIEPAEALRHFTEELHCHSEGVLAVSCAECFAETLSVHEDYSLHPYHALIDFTGKRNGECRRIAERLRDSAVKRDWLHRKK